MGREETRHLQIEALKTDTKLGIGTTADDGYTQI